jgi:hypothetical protein
MQYDGALPDDDEDLKEDRRRKEVGEAAAVSLDSGTPLEALFQVYDLVKNNNLGHAELLSRLRHPHQSLH